MRCLYCGWENLPSAQVCLKCGQTLSNNNPQQTDPYPINHPTTPLGNGESRSTVVFREVEPKPTVKFGDFAAIQGKDDGASRATSVFKRESTGSTDDGNPRNDDMQESQTPQISECTNCGYPSSTDVSVCPMCKQRKTHTIIRRRHLKTDDNTQASQIAEPTCSLTIIPEYDETIEAQKNEYHGELIVLNRNNTEQNNLTITSKEQAHLSFENGKWFISDKSDYNTTFIQVKGKVELKPGDVVMLGDRRFKFE